MYYAKEKIRKATATARKEEHKVTCLFVNSLASKYCSLMKVHPPSKGFDPISHIGSKFIQIDRGGEGSPIERTSLRPFLAIKIFSLAYRATKIKCVKIKNVYTRYVAEPSNDKIF